MSSKLVPSIFRFRRAVSGLLAGALLVPPALGGGDPIGASTRLSTRPVPQAPTTPAPASVWVPARRVFLPGTTQEVLVPGHFERVISPTQVVVPPLIVDSAGRPITVPGGDRPPADVRYGP